MRLFRANCEPMHAPLADYLPDPPSRPPQTAFRAVQARCMSSQVIELSNYLTDKISSTKGLDTSAEYAGECSLPLPAGAPSSAARD